MDLSKRARYAQLEEDAADLYADSPTSNPRRPSELIPQHGPTHRGIGPYLLVSLGTFLATLTVVALFAPIQRKCLLSSLSTTPHYGPDFPVSEEIEWQSSSRYIGPGWESAYDDLSLHSARANFSGGFIAVPDPGRYGLQGGHELLPLNSTGERQGMYSVSAFHQIHCLKMLRMSMQSLIHGKMRQHGGPEGEGGFTDHEDHCFEYIRQGLMCAADTTLESPIKGAKIAGDTDGWGAKHMCRNWKDVENWALDMAYAKWWDWEKYPVKKPS